MPKKSESLEEIARRYEALIDDDSQDENFVPVTAHVSLKNSKLETEFSLEDFRLIGKAAKKQNIAITDFVRAAALAAAAGELDLASADKVEALHDAQAKARDLAEALQRL